LFKVRELSMELIKTGILTIIDNHIIGIRRLFIVEVL
jgi:hypothetical protein